MKLASIEKIVSVTKHPNADALDIVRVLRYDCIVKKDQFKVDELVVLIQPDTVLPDKPWAAFYKAKSNRVKAIKLRQVWSFGIVESLENVGYVCGGDIVEEGLEISEKIGVTKYEPSIPQDLNAKGVLPYGMPKTDEERYQNLLTIPYGEIVDITEKIDGQSASIYCKKLEDGTWVTGVCGRTLEFNLDSTNNYTAAANKYRVIEKLKAFCIKNDVSLCIRGEVYGKSIQNFAANHWSKQNLDIAFFKTYLIDEHEYAYKDNKYYIFDIANEIGVPTVPILQKNVMLTAELIKYYDEVIEKIDDRAFEGVVINLPTGTFKVINKQYDSKK